MRGLVRLVPGFTAVIATVAMPLLGLIPLDTQAAEQSKQGKANPFGNLFLAKEGETKKEPFPGVEHIERVTHQPRVLTQHLVMIKLSPKARVVATRSLGDPNLPPGSTKMETTRAFLERTKANIAINANFFDFSAEARKKGITRLLGLSMSEGHFVSPWEPKAATFRDAIHFDKTNRIRFLERPRDIGDGFATEPAVDLWTAVTGHARLLKNGEIAVKPAADPTKDLHPRTAIGVHKDGRLALFVVDGRRPGHSMGMQTHEVAQFLKERGIVDAIQLDGGGSTTLVFGENGGAKARVVNKPSDLSERKVGNNLGIILPETENP